MNERLIEVASFPLKQVSLDSVHEKNVRHGHISTLHIWPARRPLAASRAALIATLLPDPGTDEERKTMLDRLAGHVKTSIKAKKLSGGRSTQQNVEETEGGILHWGRENSEDLNWFRQKIREAYGGRAPRVLDPFAGGGAIPLEAMRLGCEVTAADINPVAWLILKCTLEYPQRLAHQCLPLPRFVLESYEFMAEYFKSKGFKGSALDAQLASLGLNGQKKTASQPLLSSIDVDIASIEADLAWHVRAWGWWVLQQAKADLERFYPTIDNKPTVAYLWARTISCKNCRATVPLLKTRWLCKKDNKRVVLTMEPNADRTGIVFGIQENVPEAKGSGAQRREHDKSEGGGTMSRSGVTCSCCGTILTKQDIQQEGLKGRLNAVMTAVVVDGPSGKEYRLPVFEEIQIAADAENELEEVFAQIPFGLPKEPLTLDAKGNTWCILYGIDTFQKLFTPRQLLALGIFIKYTRTVYTAMQANSYPSEWIEAVVAYLALAIDRLADRGSSICSWTVGWDKIRNTFTRFALPITWDFAESVTSADSSGGYPGAIEWIAMYIEHAILSCKSAPLPEIAQSSAINASTKLFDAIVTDPPYYDSIGYAVIMDFFYVWLRRVLYGLSPEIDAVFQQPLSPKWDHERSDGELIDDSSRFDGDKQKSKESYENGMFRAFQAFYKALAPEGRLVIVFAHKQPDAWETLVSAIIRAGFVVDGSWPIQTEMGNRTRAHSSAALASSIWLVCKKRPEHARPGWDTRVLAEMQEKITHKLRNFWDEGIRGPDFIWAATGPALEAYSKHPIVKKSNQPGELLSVSEFLSRVRRMVLDFVVGCALSRYGTSMDAVSNLDNMTTYYLLHRNDFGMESVPIGPCILYAVSCGLSDSALINRYDLLARAGGSQKSEEEHSENCEMEEDEEGTSSMVRLKQWQQRKGASLGYNAPGAPAVALIDQIHRLMHLWHAGEVIKVDEYLDVHGLGQHSLFEPVLQALIELAPLNSEEKPLLEKISNHVRSRRALPSYRLDFSQQG
jgi:adenine-specific DNA methylase